MPGPADELGRALVAQRRDRGRVHVVEAPLVVDDPDRLGDLGEDGVALAQAALGLALGRRVDERHDDAAPAGKLDRPGGDGHRHHAAVAADEPVLVAVDLLARAQRLEDRALLARVGRAVRAHVVDRVVPVAPAQLRQVVVAQRRQRRGVREHDEPVAVDHPDRKRDAVEDRLQRGVGPALPGFALDPA